eukprot:scaffold2954_cov171-Amphora_coffeaeformis.AAC.11
MVSEEAPRVKGEIKDKPTSIRSVFNDHDALEHSKVKSRRSQSVQQALLNDIYDNSLHWA